MRNVCYIGPGQYYIITMMRGIHTLAQIYVLQILTFTLRLSQSQGKVAREKLSGTFCSGMGFIIPVLQQAVLDSGAYRWGPLYSHYPGPYFY